MGVTRGGDFRTPALPAWIEAREGAVVISLHVQPGARRTAIAGCHGDRLKVAISSPPSEGRANVALLEFLAGRLSVPKSRLHLVSGEASREKRVALETSMSAESVVAALAPGVGQ
jgi:uncharacterized protein (TIGR00251 family)